MTATTAVAGRARRIGAALAVRNYRLFFVGQSVSIAGTFMQTLALAFLVLRLTGSGADLGLVAGARLLPFVLLGPFGGLLADRWNTRRTLFFTQAASGIGAVVFAVLTATGVASFPVVLGLSLVLGCVTVLDNPARQSLIPDLVPRDRLANAVVLNSVSMNLARIAGSLAGGGLVAAFGLPTCFALNALSFAAVIVSLVRMRPAEMQPHARVPRRPGQVREGLRYVVRTPAVAVPLAMVTVTGVLAYEFPVSLPLLATGAFHGDAATYGAMAAVMAGGAVAGGLVAAARAGERRPLELAVTAVGWGVAIVLAAIAPTFPLVLAALVLVGYGSITFNAAAKTTLQLTAPPEMRGRVMALWAIAWSGSTVVGGPLVGAVAEAWGSRAGLLIGGVPTLLLGLALIPVLRRR